MKTSIYNGIVLNVEAQVLIAANDLYSQWQRGEILGDEITGLMAQAKANEDWIAISSLAMVVACIYGVRDFELLMAKAMPRHPNLNVIPIKSA